MGFSNLRLSELVLLKVNFLILKMPEIMMSPWIYWFQAQPIQDIHFIPLVMSNSQTLKSAVRWRSVLKTVTIQNDNSNSLLFKSNVCICFEFLALNRNISRTYFEFENSTEFNGFYVQHHLT